MALAFRVEGSGFSGFRACENMKTCFRKTVETDFLPTPQTLKLKPQTLKAPKPPNPKPFSYTRSIPKPKT